MAFLNLLERLRPHGELRGALGNHAWLLLDRGVRSVVGVAVLAAMARSLGPDAYGLFAFATAIVGFFAILGANGLDGLVVRDLVRTPAVESALLQSAFTLRLIGAGVACVLSVGTALLSSQGDAGVGILTVLLGLAYACVVFDTADLWLQSKVRSRVTVLAKGGSFLLFAGVRMALAWQHAPVEAFALATLGEAVAGATLLLAGSRKAGLAPGWLRPGLGLAPTLLRQGWPACVAVILIAARGRLDQILLGRLAGLDETAAYAIAMRFAEIWLVVPGTLMASLFPAIVRARENAPATYQARLQLLCDVLVWVAIAAAVCVHLAGPFVLNLLLGPGYERAGPVLVLLFWSAVWVFFATARTRWLVADGHMRPILLVEALAFVASLAANLVLIPAYGSIGAGVAAIAAIAAANLLAALVSPQIRASLAVFAVSLAAPVRLLVRRELPK